MEIQAFGYLGVGASNLDDWAAFATSSVGMQVVDRASSMRAFRMDDRKQRLFIDRAPSGDGRQLRTHGWHLSVVGRDARQDPLTPCPALKALPDLDVSVGSRAVVPVQ
jgi:hypothetical protein